MFAYGDTKNKIANVIIYFAKNATPKNKPLGITKLMKLLFYFDFGFYAQTGLSSTGLKYFAWPQGPVPKDVWVNLKEKDTNLDLKNKVRLLPNREDDLSTAVTTTKKFTSDEFTDLELDLLEKIAFMYKELTAKEISKLSHEKDKPWTITRETKGDKKEIDYSLAFPPTMTEEDREELNDRQRDAEFFLTAFGGQNATR